MAFGIGIPKKIAFRRKSETEIPRPQALKKKQKQKQKKETNKQTNKQTKQKFSFTDESEC